MKEIQDLKIEVTEVKGDIKLINKDIDVIKNNGTKKFLLKWGFNPRFFRKYYRVFRFR